jgi:hypothetical protein
MSYKSFFLSTSSMWTPDYNFGTTSATDIDPEGAIPGGVIQRRQTASRQEADVTIGYFPLDWLGVAIGYKGVFRGYEFENTRPISPISESRSIGTVKVSTSYNGPILGVLANTPINERFSLLGNAFAGYMFVDCTRLRGVEDTP